MEKVIVDLHNKLKKHILEEGVCLPYVLKFKRCNGAKDFLKLGIHPQSINFVIQSIKDNAITKEDICTQLDKYINGKYIIKDILDNVSGYSGEYYCNHKNDDVEVRTNCIHLIGCENVTLNIPIAKAPMIYISNECKDIKIVSQGINVININIYEDCNVILQDIKLAKSVNIYKFGKHIFVRNLKSINNVHQFEREFKVF